MPGYYQGYQPYQEDYRGQGLNHNFDFRKLGRFIADFLFAVLMLGLANYVYQSVPFQEELFQVQSALKHNAQPMTPGQINAQATAAVSRVSPAVVSVYGFENVPAGGFVVYTKITAGTGFFVTSDGYIVTNKHVVADDGYTYYVTLSNGKKLSANVTYRDPNNDFALLKVSGSNYPTVSIGDSSQVKIGEYILGVGNDYGQDIKISEGQISGLHKRLLATGDVPQQLSDVMQTTAQLYPGDSGGPLFDLDGNVVGINVATAEQTNNTSFSIPINDVKNLIPG